MDKKILDAFAVPPVILGNSPDAESHFQRGAKLVIQAEAFGDVTLVLDDPDALVYYYWRMKQQLGI
jgi:hypothetical protein